MVEIVDVRPIWWPWRIFDFLVWKPIMWVFCSGKHMGPHLCQDLTKDQKALLNPKMMVRCKGVPGAVHRRSEYDPIANITVFGGGWDKFGVFRPVDARYLKEGWRLFWDVLPPDMKTGATQVARDILKSAARASIGDGEVVFGGLNLRGEQIELCQEGEGSLKDKKGSYSRLPLL